jgi:predicted nucleotidyltransferase
MSVSERWRGTTPIALSTPEAVGRCRAVLEKDGRILVAYLFGSRREELDAPGVDTERPSGSAAPAADPRDIDLAVVTDTRFTYHDYYVLIERLGGAIGSDRVDLVWLNESEPIITFEVIRDGTVLFYRDADALNDFERKAKHRYYDYRIYLKKNRAARRRAGQPPGNADGL